MNDSKQPFSFFYFFSLSLLVLSLPRSLCLFFAEVYIFSFTYFILLAKGTCLFQSCTISISFPFQNLDEIQVKIVVLDIDDNSPVFTNEKGSNVTLGVRVNAPV